MGEEEISDVTVGCGVFLVGRVFTRYGLTGCGRGLRYIVLLF